MYMLHLVDANAEVNRLWFFPHRQDANEFLLKMLKEDEELCDIVKNGDSNAHNLEEILADGCMEYEENGNYVSARICEVQIAVPYDISQDW